MILTVTLNPCLHKFVRYHGSPEGRVVVVRPVETSFQAGGKGVNAARAIRALGGDATALTYTGGPIGELFRECVAGEGMALEVVPMRRPTRMSILTFGVDTGELREYLEAGPSIDEDEAAAMRSRFESLLDRCSLVTLNGSVPDARLDGFFAWAIERARKARKRAIVDTYGAAAPLAAKAAPFMLKANRDEIHDAFGVDCASEDEIDDFARSQLDHGVENVLITAGAAGASLWTRQGKVDVVPPRVREVNPVGSGDAMLGALAHELVAGRKPSEALRRACAAGSANAERLGICDVDRARIDELADGVKVAPLRVVER